MTAALPAAGGVTVVAICYRRPDALARLLDGLQGRFPVVVVNNTADPDVAEVGARGGAQVVPVVEDAGYARGINIGVKHLGPPIGDDDVVVFTSDDVRIDPGAVETLAAAIRAGGSVALPTACTSAGEVERTILAPPTVGRLALEWACLPDEPVGMLRWLPVEKWRLPTRPERVFGASAMTVAVRRRLLEEVPMPEAYFLYWEEVEWFYRLRQRGETVQYRPDATVVHGGGRGDIRAEKAQLLARNAVRCVRRTQGRRAAALAWPVVLAWTLRLLAMDAARAALGRPDMRRRLPARRAGVRAALGAWREVR